MSKFFDNIKRKLNGEQNPKKEKQIQYYTKVKILLDSLLNESIDNETLNSTIGILNELYD